MGDGGMKGGLVGLLVQERKVGNFKCGNVAHFMNLLYLYSSLRNYKMEPTRNQTSNCFIVSFCLSPLFNICIVKVEAPERDKLRFLSRRPEPSLALVVVFDVNVPSKESIEELYQVAVVAEGSDHLVGVEHGDVAVAIQVPKKR